MRTVKEWIIFLGDVDEMARFAIRCESQSYPLFFKDKYFSQKEILTILQPWLNDPVIKIWHHNEPNHHLLIIK